MKKKLKKNITVVGTGYVGLTLATLLSRKYDVVAIDVIQEKVDMINSGKSPIGDSLLGEYLASDTLSLTATTDEEYAYKEFSPDYVVIAVPTNYDPETRHFDTGLVKGVIEKVIRYCPDSIAVIKSTIPVGFTEKIKEETGFERIMFSPEFLREGRALNDNLHPSRIIVGCDDSMYIDACDFGEMLRRCSLEESVPMRIVGTTEAEAVKLFANTYLAGRVAFFNELDMYAEKKGLDAKNIIEGMCLEPRIGGGYNNPSFGYGGYCFPKDTKQMLANFMEEGIECPLIKGIVSSNAVRKMNIADKVVSMTDKDDVIGIYRLAMKSGSDNFRESAIQDIIKAIAVEREVVIYEPTINGEFLGCRIVDKLDEFKDECKVILSNRYDEDLNDVRDKVYTRDVYGNN